MTADTHFFPNFPPKLTHPILNDGAVHFFLSICQVASFITLHCVWWDVKTLRNFNLIPLLST